MQIPIQAQHIYMHSTCVLLDGVTEAEMFMNTQGLCISIVLFTELVNWPTFRYSTRSAGCIITQKRLNIFPVVVENSAYLIDRAC